MSSSDMFSFTTDYPLVVLFTFIPALINLGIFLYVFFYLPRNRTNSTFAFFVLVLCFWQVLEGLSHASVTAEAALVWYRMSSTMSLGVVVIETVFALRFTSLHKKLARSYYYIFLFIPAIFFNLLFIAGNDHYTMTESRLLNWIATPASNLSTELLYGWISLTSVVTLFLFIQFAVRRDTEPDKKKQARLLAIGYSVPLIGGISGEVIGPFFFHATALPITTPLITAFSIFSLIAIRKYGALDFSPRHHWESILKSMNEGLVITDLDGKIMYTNNAFSRMTGYSFRELQGIESSTLVTDNTSKIKLDMVLEERKQNAENNKNHVSLNQYLVTTKSGTDIWLIVNSIPYLDQAGKTIGTVSISSDITKLMETQKKLNDKINELNLFFYKTSHDFKTPIASMQGLLDCYSTGDNTEEFVDYVKQCTQKLSLIVGRVSQLSVIQQKQLVYSTIDCKAELEKIISELKLELGKEKEIEFDLQLQTSSLYSEIYLIRLIFRNLIENAIKYSDNAKEKLLITISINKSVEHHILRVTDNGEGISPEIQPKIFEMFYRGNDKSKGAGLGLYVVRSAAEKLNGSVAVKSRMREGSEFIIHLPIIASTP